MTLTRPGKEAAHPVAAPAPPPSPRGESTPTETPADPPDLKALRVDLQLLMWKVDQLHQATEPGARIVQAAKEIGAVAEALPQQLRDAVTAALEMQRRSALKMFSEMERKILADIGALQKGLRQPDAPASQTASVADIDDRFQWLVDAVSERFVTLGNELARIERQLTDGHPVDVKGNGVATNGNGAADHGRTGTNGADNGPAHGAARVTRLSGDQARP